MQLLYCQLQTNPWVGFFEKCSYGWVGGWVGGRGGGIAFVGRENIQKTNQICYWFGVEIENLGGIFPPKGPDKITAHGWQRAQ